MEKERLKRLVRLMSGGDAQAFREFFDLLYPRFYRFAFYYVKSDILSEEIVSDVFMKLWNNREKLHEIEQLDLYFFRAVKNQALTYIKKESKHLLVYSDEYSSKLEYVEPENLLIAKELSRKIEEAICELPDKCEIIFRLVREDGFSYKKAAELLDITPKTVENQISIATKKIKEALDGYYSQPKAERKIISFFNFIFF